MPSERARPQLTPRYHSRTLLLFFSLSLGINTGCIEEVTPTEERDQSALLSDVDRSTPAPMPPPAPIPPPAPMPPPPTPPPALPEGCNEEALTALYEHYVEPFVSGTQSTSCSACHLTGVDMSLYAQDTPCQTMACLIQSGEADLESPDESELLARILLGDPSSSAFSVEREHEAFLEWFEWSARCHDAVCGEISDPCAAGSGAPSGGGPDQSGPDRTRHRGTQGPP